MATGSSSVGGRKYDIIGRWDLMVLGGPRWEKEELLQAAFAFGLAGAGLLVGGLIAKRGEFEVGVEEGGSIRRYIPPNVDPMPCS